jgi:hypothetical protein
VCQRRRCLALLPPRSLVVFCVLADGDGDDEDDVVDADDKDELVVERLLVSANSLDLER